MASQKFGFVTVDPVSGSGDQAVSISGDKYTGRLERTANLIVVTNGGVQKALVVNQAAAAESVTSDSPTATVAKTGGNVTITGKSNSTKLTFAATPAEENGLTLQLPENYTAAGKQTANGAVIADDPGATGEFVWSITISNVPANVSIEELVATLSVTAAGGQKAQVTITQAAGDSTLEIDKEIIEAKLDDSRLLNEEKSAKYEEIRTYENNNLHEFFLDDQNIYIPEYDRNNALSDGAIAGKITIIGLEFDMTEGKILIGMMDKYDNDLTTALGDKQKQISIATTVEQVRAVDVQSGYPDKVSVTTAYIQQQAKEKDALDPQKVAVEFSRMLVNDKSLSLSSNEKLDVKVLFPIWGQEGAEFGLSVDTGFCLRVVKEDTDILYEVIQPHTLSSEWEPGLSTASLYKVVDKEHAGTIGDPIPYFPPMEIFKDKYYIQNADVYKCTRDSGTPLSHNLKDLVGLYVEVVQG